MSSGVSTLESMDRAARALELALQNGFDIAGIAPLRRPTDAERFERWLSAGYHADMEWLARQRHRIVDPERILPGGKSLLIVGLAHSRPGVRLRDGARIARYAAGRDYHNWMGKRLRRLAKGLVAAGIATRTRSIVDAGPLLERSHAAEAGLGFPSKAANLLHPRFGPWFFLGELLLDTELTATTDLPSGSCGTCTACIDACPTAAIRESGVIDANLCISYHTIENRGTIPHELRDPVSEWLFGCDICSEVCPWGRHAPDTSGRLGTHQGVEWSLVDWLLASREGFAETSEGSALRRPHREGLARNAALALSRFRSEEARTGLFRALRADPSPRVREAAFWALSEGYSQDAGVRGALERALASEPDALARQDMQVTAARR